MKIAKYSIYSIVVLIPLLIGCAPSREPLLTATLPDEFALGAEADTNSWALVHWREFFKDPQLQALIQEGLENNQDVLKTFYAIQRAQANLRQAKLGQLPEVNAYVGTGIRRFGEYTMDGVGNADSNQSPTVPEDKKIPDPYRDFTLGLDFNWEIDIWGKLSMQKKQALARYMESEEIYSLAKTNLIASIAETYYLAAGLSEEIRILEENIAIQERQFELGKSLKETGQDSQLSLDQFEALLLNSRGMLLDKRKLLQHANLTLMQLTASADADVNVRLLKQTDSVPEVLKLGIPADLLRLRPDVRAAERNLEAQNLQTNIARTAFFPTFNIAGLAGFNAFDFGRLFQTPASAVYQVGGGLVAPVFNRNRIQAYYQTAKADQRIALLDYEQTALISYLEILRLVNDFQFLGEQLALKSEEVNIQKRSIDNAITMFRIGYADYLDVINSQSRSLESELAYVQLRVDKLQNYSQLYRALGGGWQ
ncbi:MAG: efflux transporter outer membrane subunit [Lunatimonas sp.]|uniref:efflux transporter outer membrane subunit n=1 Tax=Lunatimonas sp. TaxID=2060141 RepID=UPI00263A3EF6|nr:efflux transporter outer membrane subunit [Lunatimonas sp.]MCC5939485.1 efflux transporter outer membrane subunit [Lunatimonas sp.]